MKEELIEFKVTKGKNGNDLVSARELHEKLGLKKRFSVWIEQYVKENNDYLFENNVDFTSVLSSTVVNNGAKRELQDYGITFDMAKEICMVTKNEQGKKCRKWFIEKEKELKSLKETMTPSYMIENPIERAKKWIEEETIREQQQKQLEEQKPLVEFANKVSNSSDCIKIRELAKLIKDEGVDIGEKRLFKWLRDNNYLMKNNEPYQRYIEQGLFQYKEYTYTTPYGDKLSHITLVTGKGQIYFVEKFKEEN